MLRTRNDCFSYNIVTDRDHVCLELYIVDSSHVIIEVFVCDCNSIHYENQRLLRSFLAIINATLKIGQVDSSKPDRLRTSLKVAFLPKRNDLLTDPLRKRNYNIIVNIGLIIVLSTTSLLKILSRGNHLIHGRSIIEESISTEGQHWFRVIFQG